jgi:hypothetical protein
MAIALVLGCVFAVVPARGETPEVARARPHFNEGVEHVKAARWGEAIAAFERAGAISPHAVTTFNIGACERAMGRYTRAARSLRASLDQNDASRPRELPDRLASDARALLAEVEGLLVHVTLSIGPAAATLAIDGRPVTVLDAKRRPVLVAAGIAAAQGGDVPPAAEMDVTLDPGPHVMVVSRAGHAPAVVSRTFTPGEHTTLRIELDLLPASLHIESNRNRAAVTVDGLDVGPPPLDIKRRPGDVRVVIREDGYVPYDTRVALVAGEETRLNARLIAEKPTLFSRWWFWTATGVVIAGAAGATYALTRPEPQRAEVGGGTLGWSVAIP